MTARLITFAKQICIKALWFSMATLFAINLASFLLPSLYQPNHIQITSLDESSPLHIKQVWIDQAEVSNHPLQRFTQNKTLQPSSNSPAIDEAIGYRNQLTIQFNCFNDQLSLDIHASTLKEQQQHLGCQSAYVIVPAPKINQVIFIGVHLVCMIIGIIALKLVTNRVRLFATQTDSIQSHSLGNYLLVMFPPIIASMMLFWPGHFCNDALDQFRQIDAHSYSNFHPIIHTFLLLPFHKISQPMFYVGLLYAALIGLSLGILHVFKKKFSLTSSYLFILLVFYNPAVLIMMTTYWKDIPFSLALIGSSVWLYHLVEHRERKTSAWQVVLFSLLIFLMATLRHNGVVSYGILILLTWVTGLKIRKQLLIFSLSMLLGWQLLVRLLIPQASPLDFSTFTALHYLSGYALTHPSTPQINSLVDLVPDTLLAGYSSWNSNWLVLSYSINHQNIITFKLQVLADLAVIILRDPITIWEIFLERAGYAVYWLYDGRPVYWMQFDNLSQEYRRNPFGLDYPANEIRNWLIILTNERFIPYFWPIGLLSLLPMFVFILGKEKLKSAALFLPLLVQYPLILMTAPGPDYRYFFFMLLAGPLALVILFNQIERLLKRDFAKKH